MTVSQEGAIMVIVYTQPSCFACKATTRHLTNLGIEFKTVDVTERPDALEYVQSLGYTTAPVVANGAEHWSGYRPSKIEGLAGQQE